MKVTVKERDVSKMEREYPYLGIYELTGCIMLFTSPETGVLIRKAIKPSTLPPSSEQVGYYSDGYAEHIFTPFVGEVVLSND